MLKKQNACAGYENRKERGISKSKAPFIFFSVPNGGLIEPGLELQNVLASTSNGILLAAGSFLMIIGMYVFNDLVDADLDRLNGKKRPISTGQVSKRNARSFIILTNVTGFLLASIMLNVLSMLIALMIMSIGLMYSAPKVELKDRFLVKTLSIAIAMMLCTILGSTANWNVKYPNDNSHIDKLVYAALMLGIMVFITSPFNDVADATGDKVAGRRTIPVVIGKENTIKMAIYLAISMPIVSWLLYSLHTISKITPVLVSLTAMMTIINLIRTLKHLDDSKFVRKQHKRSLPLYIMLQSTLIIGAILFWI
jgi:geranylgeranylglycerol-phosphate geranylgeranyltransferase